MSSSKFVIYGLFDPRDGELRYVGQSSRGKDRFWEHTRYRELSKSTHLAAWLRALAAVGLKPSWGVIHNFDLETALNDAEIYWIAYFKNVGCRLTNFSMGGGKPPAGWVMPEATRQKLSERALGRRWTTEMRLKLSAIHKARMENSENRRAVLLNLEKAWKKPITRATREKMSVARLGKSRPQSVVEKMQATSRSRMRDPAYRAKRGARAIVDDLGVVYESQHAAARALGLTVGNIGSAIHGYSMSAGGRRFRFLENV